MTTQPRHSTYLPVLALLVALAGPALAEAPNSETSTVPLAVEPADAQGTAPAETPTEPAINSAVEQSSQFGDCDIFCDGQVHTHSWVTREECCGGTLACPDGSESQGIAFYPYQGFPEICS